MNIDIQKIIGGIILLAGLAFFLFVVTAKEFEYSIIVASFTLISWITYMLTIEKNQDYKQIGNVIITTGIIMGIAIFFVFGVEEVAFPRGSFQFKASGIVKSLAVILFSLVPALLFYVVEETLPRIAKARTSLPQETKKQPINDYDDDIWEEVSEEEITSNEFEAA